MRSLLGAAIVLCCAASAEASLWNCTFRIHRETREQARIVFAQHLRLLAGRSVHIRKTPSITERDVEKLYSYRGADGSDAGIGAFLVVESISLPD